MLSTATDFDHTEGVEDVEEELSGGLEAGDGSKGIELDADEQGLMCDMCGDAEDGASSLYDTLDKGG